MSDTTTYKGCLICGGLAPSNTLTCPNDGEASWANTAAYAPLDPPAEDPAPDAAVDPAAPAPVKRGKK